MAAAPTDEEVALGVQAVWDTRLFKWEGFRKYSVDDVREKFAKLPKKIADRSTFLLGEAAGDNKGSKKKKKKRTPTPTFDTEDTKLLRCQPKAAEAIQGYMFANNLTPIHVSNTVFHSY